MSVRPRQIALAILSLMGFHVARPIVFAPARRMGCSVEIRGVLEGSQNLGSLHLARPRESRT